MTIEYRCLRESSVTYNSMFGYLKRKYRNHLDEVLSTIKLIDIEERYDIHFSRFYGLYFAKMAKWLKLTPTHVSFISLFFGVIGGALFYFQDDIIIVSTGGFLVIFAGVLDSSDGQLARMTGQSSDIGRMIDGMIDNLVFFSFYVGGTLFLFKEYGWPVLILGAAAVWTHSYKATMYEFYKSEYLYLVGRSDSGKIALDKSEVEKTGDKWYDKFVFFVNKDYTGKQIAYSTRTQQDRIALRKLSATKGEAFDELYRKYNMKLLFWWAWLGGSNTHRNAAIVCAILGRFELFLIASTIWTIGYLPLNLKQKKYDQKLLNELTN